MPPKPLAPQPAGVNKTKRRDRYKEKVAEWEKKAALWDAYQASLADPGQNAGPQQQGKGFPPANQASDRVHDWLAAVQVGTPGPAPSVAGSQKTPYKPVAPIELKSVSNAGQDEPMDEPQDDGAAAEALFHQMEEAVAGAALSNAGETATSPSEFPAFPQTATKDERRLAKILYAFSSDPFFLASDSVPEDAQYASVAAMWFSQRLATELKSPVSDAYDAAEEEADKAGMTVLGFGMQTLFGEEFEKFLAPWNAARVARGLEPISKDDESKF